MAATGFMSVANMGFFFSICSYWTTREPPGDDCFCFDYSCKETKEHFRWQGQGRDRDKHNTVTGWPATKAQVLLKAAIYRVSFAFPFIALHIPRRFRSIEKRISFSYSSSFGVRLFLTPANYAGLSLVYVRLGIMSRL